MEALVAQLSALIHSASAWLQAHPETIFYVMGALILVGLIQLGAEQLAWTRAWLNRNKPRQVNLSEFEVN